jgi:two-component system sensor histidine kinase BaeS
MRWLAFLHPRLGLKIFISYLAVILVGAIVLLTAAGLAIPNAFERHLAVMADMLHPTSELTQAEIEADLFNNFRSAVTEAVAIAGLAAFLAAVVVSLLVSRQVVAPVTEMERASRHIADGHYGERVYVVGGISSHEPDELGQLALSFNQMADRLEKTEILRRELIADVTHELRTPLTTIKGTLEGMLDGVLAAEPSTLQQIYQEAHRLDRLVNDLQELSRVEAGAFELHLQPSQLSELVESTASRLRGQFEEKGVRLKKDLPPNLPQVLVDEDRLGQVLLNLIGNALQYTPSGGTVSIRLQRSKSELQVVVADTGAGVQPEHLPHLFTRFFRVDKSRSRAGGGSGIGLTIAKYLVEAHGGRIWADSQGLGQGSTFTISLPIAR